MKENDYTEPTDKEVLDWLNINVLSIKVGTKVGLENVTVGHFNIDNNDLFGSVRAAMRRLSNNKIERVND